MSEKIDSDRFEQPKYQSLVPSEVLQHFPRDDDVKCRSSIFKHHEKGDDVPLPMSIEDYMVRKSELPLKEATLECFPVGSLWCKQDLTLAMNSFGKLDNFSCSWNDKHLRCKFAPPRNRNSKISIKTKCNFGITITPVFSGPPNPASKAKTKARNLLLGGSDLVLISKVCAEHNDRDLTSEEYICSLKRSGEISKNSISPLVIYQLVQLHETEPSLPITTVRYLLNLQQCGVVQV